MKKIYTITFHSSYNYGSNLQAYSLQEYIKKLCDYDCEYKIINLRTPIQRQMYEIDFDNLTIKKRLKTMLVGGYKKNYIEKQKKFEDFINNNLDITKEYTSLDELKKEKFEADYYISGSDQLWNLQAMDFDWSYFLEFINNGKKISYAASFGPKAQTWNEKEMQRVKDNLSKYSMISVREEGSFNNVKKLLEIEPEINVDPTMLLEKHDWEKIISKEPIYKGKYIFLYNLKGDKNILKIAKKVSKKLDMPIVVSKYGNKLELIYGFKKKYNSGPIEFLNLIQNAELVLSSSFHGTIFSILLNKPFFAINGAKDFRISTLLKKMELEDRSIEIDNIDEKCKKIYDIHFAKSEKLLDLERKKSEKYLKKALDIN